ncbi:MAG TPA: DUF1269 domain-containing protein [Thermoanaerobaculia bacterium]|nr:DUF1269 domain-containing protein [Thermoanaerobaculia bacterium]
MDKMIVAVFEDERSAYEGVRALRELDDEGTISTYATAVLAKDPAGKVTVKQAADQGPLGTAVGMLSGSLIGLVAGPVGLAIGLGVGALGGIVYDLAKIGIDDDFLGDVGTALGPGRFAVVGEILEDWVAPLDSRIEAAGGILFRRARGELIDAQIERDVTTLKNELASLKAEAASAAKETKAKLEAKIEAARQKMQVTEKKAKAALEAVQHESEAKVKALQAKAAKAHGMHKEKLEKRIGEVRVEYKQRGEKLAQAWALAKEALS